jgi:hypothetical protein
MKENGLRALLCVRKIGAREEGAEGLFGDTPSRVFSAKSAEEYETIGDSVLRGAIECVRV